MPVMVKDNTQERKQSAISIVFVGFICVAILVAAFTGRMEEVTRESFEAAKSSVTLAIGLIGIMALWLGLMRVLEAGGLMRQLARALKPVMRRLFPDVPAEHPAMSAMILNISANILGLGNAATPFGIRAMMALQKLNPHPETATNAMCLFLAINTSSVTLLPLGVIGVRAAAGSSNPAAIMIPTLLATLVSTTVAIVSAKLLAGRAKSAKRGEKYEPVEEPNAQELEEYAALQGRRTLIGRFISWALIGSLFVVGIKQARDASSVLDFVKDQLATHWLMPLLMLAILAYGINRGVKIYEAVTEGAKQGFEVAVRIIPFLVAILVAIGMFRASGAMEVLIRYVSPLTELIYMPAEVLPMALLRPLSGSGAFAVMTAIIQNDPDSYSAFVASTMMGSTETTFYVLAVYFGAVGVTRVRYALAAALLADTAGIVAACFASKLFYQPVI